MTGDWYRPKHCIRAVHSLLAAMVFIARMGVLGVRVEFSQILSTDSREREISSEPEYPNWSTAGSEEIQRRSSTLCMIKVDPISINKSRWTSKFDNDYYGMLGLLLCVLISFIIWVFFHATESIRLFILKLRLICPLYYIHQRDGLNWCFSIKRLIYRESNKSSISNYLLKY